MNKKFLSAILFGALMVTSTGTFVSCKDYDDDIENLQTQIDKNSSAIAELQKLVGQGKWVSSISSIENGFTVTMSDGSSHQIKGINGKDGADGKDGKNGTEWTIGEDGFWYVDGEKTENVAVAKDGKDGKNGVTAPAPSIGADGNWVVYTWDEAKGEFVAEATEIPAAGTAAYAVEADGVYTLHIADENGEYQEIALPATCDSFVALAPAAQVNVTFEQANWTPVKTKADKELFAKMVKEFPELAEYEKGDLMMQGGNLPVIISPANVELTDKYTFALQSAKGVISEAKVSNPVKGMPAVDYCNGVSMVTRSAEANDAYWTLSVEPAKNKKGDKYVGISFSDTHSLIVENEKGTVVKTAFAYGLSIIRNEDVTIETSLENVDLEDAIDVLAKNENNQSVFTINHGLNGYYLLEATDILEIEKYGITIEGSKLMIANMPADQTSITVDLKLIAVGLNGSVEEAETTLTIGQAIAVNGTLADKTVTLGYNKAKNNYNVPVRWNIADLEFTATQLNQFLEGTTKTLYVKYENEEGEMVYADPASVTINAYDKNGKTEDVTYKNAETFGFDLDSQTWEPGEYTIRLEVETADGSVIYAAEAVLTVENPELGEADVKLVPGFVDENGVYQITGNYSEEGIVTYALENALILNKNVAEIINIFDKDYNDYSEEEREDEAYEMCDWVPAAYTLKDTKTWTLNVNKWAYANDTQFVNPAEEWSAYVYNQLYQTRNIRAMLKLFGNDENVVPFDFQVEVKSELYAEKVTDAITIDGTKLVGVFGAKNADGTLAAIDIKAAVTKAVSMAGTNKGKTYSLFATGKAITTGSSAAVINLSSPKTAGDYVLGTNGNIVTLTVEQYLAMCSAFNVTADTENYVDGNKTYKLKIADWNAIWAVAANYYTTAGKAIYAQRYQYEEDGTTIKTDANGNPLTENWTVKVNGADTPMFQYSYANGTELTDKEKTEYLAADKAKMAIYTTFKAMIAFNNSTEAVSGTAGTALDKARDARVESVTIKFNEVEVAEKYFTLSDAQKVEGIVFTDAAGTNYSNIKITPVVKAPNSVTGDQVKVAMTLTIRDAWGMIMNVPFEVTVKTSAN